MALELIEKGEKKGYYKIYLPNQKPYAASYEFKGHKFVFFKANDQGPRGKIFGKGLRPTYAPNGDIVTDFGIQEILNHFTSLGFVAEEYSSDGKKIGSTNGKIKPIPKKEESKKEVKN